MPHGFVYNSGKFATISCRVVDLRICRVRYSLLFSLLKFLVAISSHVSLPSEFLHIWAYGDSPCHKGKNRDEKKPVSEIAGALCFEFLVAKYCSDVPLLQNFSPAATITLPPAFPPPQGYNARRKQIDSVATYSDSDTWVFI